MRDCPVCNSHYREVLWTSPFLVPDGWTKPPYLDWCECECGMLYADNPDATQADYDIFYKERYGFGVVDSGVHARLHNRAHMLAAKMYHNNRVVDFGGGESGLKEILMQTWGFTDVHNYGVGDTMPANVDVIIAEHVLEHIYDMNAAMETITSSLKPGGMLIIDIPDAGRMAFDRPAEMPMLDFSQVHINHFRTIDMLNLMKRWGFELYETKDYFERFIRSRMFVFIKGMNVGRTSRQYVQDNIAVKLEALKRIGNREVIVWGCGDIALHCLALHPLNVAYFVDIDPAYQGATINSIQVLDKPHSNHPIVVNCSTQKSLLLRYIEEQGYTNELIVI